LAKCIPLVSLVRWEWLGNHEASTLPKWRSDSSASCFAHHF